VAQNAIRLVYTAHAVCDLGWVTPCAPITLLLVGKISSFFWPNVEWVDVDHLFLQLLLQLLTAAGGLA